MEPRRYKCLPWQELTKGSYRIRTVQDGDIESIRLWRNAQINVLRQRSTISQDEQERYFEAHIWPSMEEQQPKQILMSYMDGVRLIGYGGLVHIAWEHRRAEVSFLVESERAADLNTYAADFGNFLALIRIIGFSGLGLHRLFTETYATRRDHILVLETAGFRREGVMCEHVFIDGEPVDCFLHGCLGSYEG